MNKRLCIFLILTTTSSSTIFAMEPDENQEVTISQARLDKFLVLQNYVNQELIISVRRWQTDETQVNQLLSNGAEINATNERGESPLMGAAGWGRDNICKILINAHAQIDAKDLDGLTALMYAAYHSHEAVCKCLIDNGAQVDVKIHDGGTALIMATDGNPSRRTADCITTVRTLITYPIFNPFLSENEFQISRQRIWTALCLFKRACPSLPKDLRKHILCSLPELEKDVQNAGVFGIFKDTTAADAPLIPLPAVRLLIENGMLPPRETVAAIKAYHFECIKPLMVEAMLVAPTNTLRAILDPDRIEQNFGKEIEQNIQRRLGLPSNAEDTAKSEKPSKCSLQ